MKISELIKALEEKKAQFGDVQVMVGVHRRAAWERIHVKMNNDDDECVVTVTAEED